MKYKLFRNIALVTISSVLVCSCDKVRRNPDLFYIAYQSVLDIKEENIRPLVNLNKDDKRTIWNDNGEVLLFTLHHNLESYAVGKSGAVEGEEIWLYSTKEMRDWYMLNKMNTFDRTIRLKQLLGKDYNSKDTYVSTLWINPNKVYRPAFVNDVNKDMQTSFDDTVSSWFKEWFRKSEIYSYETNKYPWTRLGYSFDWGSDSDRYGLSEFISFNGSQFTVDKTLTIEHFYSYLETL